MDPSTETLRLKIAQKPYIVWSLGPKASKYESLEPKGKSLGRRRAKTNPEDASLHISVSLKQEWVVIWL